LETAPTQVRQHLQRFWIQVIRDGFLYFLNQSLGQFRVVNGWLEMSQQLSVVEKPKSVEFLCRPLLPSLRSIEGPSHLQPLFQSGRGGHVTTPSQSFQDGLFSPGAWINQCPANVEKHGPITAIQPHCL